MVLAPVLVEAHWWARALTTEARMAPQARCPVAGAETVAASAWSTRMPV
jgi:hypothetical protein